MMLNLDFKEMMAVASAFVASVVWFVRLEARSVRNKEELDALKTDIIKLEAQREKDVLESREARRLAESHLQAFSDRVDHKFDRIQNTMEKILVELGSKADR